MRLPQLQQPAIRPMLPSPGPQSRRTALTVFDPELLTETVREAGFEHRQLHRGCFRGELTRSESGG